METIKISSKLKNILFVDSDISLTQEIREILNRDKTGNSYGLNITFAKDAREAMKKMSELKIDLIVMEIVLPLINGYFLLNKTIKEKIPTVIYTKLKESQDIAKMAASGVDNIFIKELTKPIELIEKLSKETSLKIDLNKMAPELQSQIMMASGDETHSKIKIMQCPRCNSVLAPDSRFCNNCGQKISVNLKVVGAKTEENNNENEEKEKTTEEKITEENNKPAEQ
ncbi:response regulator [Candidatus Peregrinibacteria bacterium]|nr:response regulator [Candidatus Peregrinibacteria bacterium]